MEVVEMMVEEVVGGGSGFRIVTLEVTYLIL